MRKIFCMFVFIVLVSGCVMTNFYTKQQQQLSFINYNKNIYPAYDKDYPIDLYFQDKPQKQYDVIGEIMGTVNRGEELRPTLESKVREVGGDGVVDIETTQGTITKSRIRHSSVMDLNGNILGEMPVDKISTENVINVRAKVIKYKQ